MSFAGTAGCTTPPATSFAGRGASARQRHTHRGNNLTLTVNDGAGHTGSVVVATVRTQFAAWSGGAAFAADANGGISEWLGVVVLSAANSSAIATALLPSDSRWRLVTDVRCLRTAESAARARC